ncbi:AzlD domain-containing protein [Streptococcaceae bacterium ESL0729]|nr:AzlD domain-containing protein [Streptococcaceae bacterium ESL0729]
MPSFNYVILTILGCTLVTWLSRVLPFILLKHFDLPKAVSEYLAFVPTVIMSALWFNSLFVQRLGHLPGLNQENLLASLPTVLAAAISKSLLVTVLIGVLSLALIRMTM